MKNNIIHGWLNVYKPRNISSAKVVNIIKYMLKTNKAGHAGTLDLEAEGVLPIALGEATKLVNIVMQFKKKYKFTIMFGAKTDTADSSGVIIDTTQYIPSRDECHIICDMFIGEIEQIPPSYSALKINGKRAYQLARSGKKITLIKRRVKIFSLKCIEYDENTNSATYLCDCSKGTYVRTLAEDIALSLQSLGFVIELKRLEVGMFDVDQALHISKLRSKCSREIKNTIQKQCLKTETVLKTIPVLNATYEQAKKIRFGQNCCFSYVQDQELIWVKNANKIVAIGNLHQGNFKSSRVFNL